MPKVVSSKELNAIEEEIQRHAEGIGMVALEAALSSKLHGLSRRTLLRRLAHLLDASRVVAERNGVRRVYKMPATVLVASHVGTTMGVPSVELYPPISAESVVVRDTVRQPLMYRTPVGYNRAFLEDYQPNRTYYLPQSTREILHQLGRTPIGERPAGTYARDIMNRLLVDLSWASSRLEGNTYTRLDTQNLIEFGQVAAGKAAQETQMILNHKAAIELLIEEVDQVGCDLYTFLNLHAVLSDNLMHDPMASGRIRQRQVEISGTVFYPLAVPQQIEDFFRLLLAKAEAIADPFEQAFFLMVQLPYLQPFEDVNKRVSRLGANIPLIRRNLCPLSFVDVPENAYVEGTQAVYELNRVELLRDVFVWAYERSCQRYLAVKQSLADPDPFRLKYRTVLMAVVQHMVRKGITASPENVRAEAEDKVANEDIARFVGMVVDDLVNLYEGNVARYRLRRDEFLLWKARQEIEC